VVTHGVGPMRRYVLGAILLDRDDPGHVIGHLEDPLLEPDETERDGAVPNVVFVRVDCSRRQSRDRIRRFGHVDELRIDVARQRSRSPDAALICW
jgi:predicted GH43/DUF377 family glycosyl hydrolase